MNLQLNSVTVSEFAKLVYSDVLGEGFLIADDLGSEKFSIDARNIKRSSVEAVAKKMLNNSKIKVSKFAGLHYIQKSPVAEFQLLTYKPNYKAVSYLSELALSAFPFLSSSGQQVVKSDGQAAVPLASQNVSHGVSDKQNTDLVVFHAPVDKHEKIIEFLDSIDTKSDQVLLSAIAYEVASDIGSGSAVDVVLNLVNGKFGLSATSGFKGSSTVSLNVPNVSAVINLLDGDSRFKSLTRPNVRVLSGSSARFNVGSEVPILAAVVSNNNGQSQSVEYRNSGVSLEVSPVVRNSIIDLKIKQEISNFVQTTTGVNNSPTLNKRFIETDLNLKDGEVILIGGLEDSQETASEKNIPFFKWPFAKSKFKRTTETVLMIEVKKI